MTNADRPSGSLCPGQAELWSRITPSQGGPDQLYRERFPIAPFINRHAGQVLARGGPVDMHGRLLSGAGGGSCCHC